MSNKSVQRMRLRRIANLTVGRHNVMKFLFRYPVLSGLLLEALLILLFCLFPAGACNAPFLGIVVVYLHFPALLFVEGVLGIGFSAKQLLLSAGLMVPVWIALFFLLRWLWSLKSTHHAGQPGAAPNGGPATPVGNSGVTGGPPSVS